MMPHKKDPEDPRMLKIETEVARVAIMSIIKRAREWVENAPIDKWTAGDLLSYLESIESDNQPPVTSEILSKAIDMARENNEGVEITISPEMKYTKQQILEKLIGGSNV